SSSCVRENTVSMLFLKPTTSEASDPLCFLPATPKSFAECESRLDFVMEELDFVMEETVWF
ncbi:MAG: hypothetical protein QF922_06555, partial [SAR324 cluster bacterium]|nr:hypothetical protein [SAR324 cluster bacterium]